MIELAVLPTRQAYQSIIWKNIWKQVNQHPAILSTHTGNQDIIHFRAQEYDIEINFLQF